MKKGILIVDDELHVLEAIKREMHDLRDEYQVFITSDCSTVFDIIAENDIDVLVTDILMPEKDGIQIIAETVERFPRVKIITMSGGGKIDAATYLQLSSALGASSTLNKPFSRNDLVKAIRGVLVES